jgi:hypothetical protein
MSDAWTVIGTLGGALVGWASAVATQRGQWKREQSIRWDAVRREAYGSYLERSNAYHLALTDVAWAIRRDRTKLEPNSIEANRLRAEVVSLKSHVDMLASKTTLDACNALYEHL